MTQLKSKVERAKTKGEGKQIKSEISNIIIRHLQRKGQIEACHVEVPKADPEEVREERSTLPTINSISETWQRLLLPFG